MKYKKYYPKIPGIFGQDKISQENERKNMENENTTKTENKRRFFSRQRKREIVEMSYRNGVADAANANDVRKTQVYLWRKMFRIKNGQQNKCVDQSLKTAIAALELSIENMQIRIERQRKILDEIRA